MSGLEKAELQVLDKRNKATRAIPVQFNPTTLQLQMTNSVDGGTARGRQTQQYNGSSSTTLSIDLEFDTADEGTPNKPVDVRTKTAEVAQFMIPGGKRSKQAPPKLLFRWGTFELAGVMTSLTEELSLFSSTGAALRSKLTVQIKEQDLKYEALERGAGANDDTNPPASGEKDKKKGNGPGTGGGGPADQAAEALDGETPADFLARNGLAPEAWRALGDALSSVSDGVELQAGVAVDFSSSLTVGVGVGVSAGFQAGLDVSVDAALGLAADVSGGADADLDAGFALAAAGGVTAAAETAASTDAQVAADSTRESFGMATGGGGSATTPAPSGAARSPVATTPSARTGASGSGPAAPLPPRADKRATTYGRGVPLRDRVTAPDGRSGDGGYVVVGATARGDLVPVGHDRRSAPWESLSPSPTRDAADREQHRRTPSCGCHRCDPRGRQAYRS